MEITEISYEKLSPMPVKSVSIFHHTFYLEPQIDLEDAKISQEKQQKL